ncbi:MAG TPA: hypothetical protein VHL77_01475, partial [Ferruginibacter sp.]|nr:hypothetical protein [Ferruginibacter sp.]
MQYRSVKGYSGWGQVGILLAFLGAGFILAGVVQFIIGMQLVPKGLPLDKMGEEMLNAMLKPENVGFARLSQVLSTFCLFFLPAVAYMLICHG